MCRTAWFAHNADNFNRFRAVRANRFLTMFRVPQIDLGEAEIQTSRAARAAFGIGATAVPRGPIVNPFCSISYNIDLSLMSDNQLFPPKTIESNRLFLKGLTLFGSVQC